MTRSKSILSYTDVREAFDRAMLNEKGCAITLKDPRAVTRWIARANMFRVLDRQENEKLYETTHSLYGRSAYDVLKVYKSPDNERMVKIEPISLDVESIMDL